MPQKPARAMLSFRWHTQTQAQTGNATHTKAQTCVGVCVCVCVFWPTFINDKPDRQTTTFSKKKTTLACQNKRIDTKREVDRSPYVCVCVFVWVSVCYLMYPGFIALFPCCRWPLQRIKCIQPSSLSALPVSLLLILAMCVCVCVCVGRGSAPTA